MAFVSYVDAMRGCPVEQATVRVADMPNWRLGGRAATTDDVAADLAFEDWAHADLLMWC